MTKQYIYSLYDAKTGALRAKGTPQELMEQGYYNRAESVCTGYTQPQLNTMLNKYNTMKPTDQGYDYYTETLADAGRIPRLSGTGNPGRSNGTAYEQGMYHARQWANGGYSQSQIASKLANETGLSNDLISSIHGCRADGKGIHPAGDLQYARAYCRYESKR